MAKPSFDQFAEMLERVVQHIPPRFCEDLPGGFNVQREKRCEGEYYILGEYVEDYYLGSFIVFYYGSFVALLEGEPWEAWEAEILDTVLHELQHHREALAGRDDLGQQELAELLRDEQEEASRDKPKESRGGNQKESPRNNQEKLHQGQRQPPVNDQQTVKNKPTEQKSFAKTLRERLSKSLKLKL